MMRRFVVYSLSLTLLWPAAQCVLAQGDPAEAAAKEAVRRQEFTILLRRTLKDAQSEQKKGDLGTAAKLYEEAWSLVQQIGDAGIEKEKRETIAGFTEVYLALAKKSFARAQYEEAKTQLNRVLRVDPKNEEGLKMMATVDKRLKELEGRLPSRDAKAMLPEAQRTKIESATLTQDGKLLYEAGKYDEAEARLKQAAKLDPDNAAAFYYLRLVEEARYEQEARKREISIKNKIVEVEKAWNPPVKWGNVTNAANPFARTNIVHTGPGRREIFDKLDKIRFDRFPRRLEGLAERDEGFPLREVIKLLDEEVRDAEVRLGGTGRGINFIIANYVDIVTQQSTLGQTIDTTTGQPISTGPQQEQFNVGDVLIHLDPPLRNVRLADVLDAIVKVANKQIKYSVEEYAIVFTRKVPEEPQLFTRTFRLNPNTFFQGLQNVVGYQFVGSSLSGGGYGGGM
ncbi:MAG: tetratricopeptide repeat protein, partial [Verrucomicrobiae bacterium]|nr:tetratricopeptide repeat protein [Verrucomicrobiae bacterium]